MVKKHKNIVLGIGFAIGMVLCYHLAFSKTFALRKEYMQLKGQQTLFENLPKQVSLLKQKQRYFDSLLLKYQRNGSSIQNNLLQTINAFADSTKIKVVGFLEPHTLINNDLKITTYQFTLEGDYNNMLKLIHMLEQKTKFGEVTSLHFEKKKDFKSDKFFLQVHVLLKSLG